MLRSPVAFQRFSDGFGVGFDVWIAQLGKLCAIPLSSQNGVHNGTACQSGNVTDDHGGFVDSFVSAPCACAARVDGNDQITCGNVYSTFGT
jgi:hypothetical protein